VVVTGSGGYGSGAGMGIRYLDDALSISQFDYYTCGYVNSDPTPTTVTHKYTYSSSQSTWISFQVTTTSIPSDTVYIDFGPVLSISDGATGCNTGSGIAYVDKLEVKVS
jgi:hypothetical protein